MTDHRLLPGSNLGPYKIVRLIGKGGMGEVYEAREELLHRSVALKVMTDEAMHVIHQGVDLFIKEGKALAQLNHPHVVTIYQLGYDKGIHYIAMEYVEGPDLEEYIGKLTFDAARCVSVFHKVLLGVRALHRKGIIHRDLKPKNIIVQDEKKIKIVDFGIAYIVQDNLSDQTTNEFMGSVHYASPEVMQGGLPTFQSDIWSLGVIFYQILTTHKPFSGNTRTEVLKKVCEEEINFDNLNSVFIPQKLKDMVRKMCSKNPEERYQSIDEILQQLGENVAPPPPSRWSNLVVPGLIASLMVTAVTVIILDQKKKPVPVVVTQPLPILKPAPIPVVVVAPAPVQTQVAAPAPSPLVAETIPTPPPAPVKKVISQQTKKPQAPQPLPQTRLKSDQGSIVLAENAKSKKRGVASVNNGPLLSWHSVAQAETYEIQIASNNRFQNPIIEQNLRETQYRWNNAKPGNYFWRVRALSNKKPDGEFSPVANLKLLLPKPVLNQPSFKFLLSESKPSPFTVGWAGHTLASSYRVILAKEASMAKPIKNEVLDNPEFTFSAEPGKYYLQIVALNPQREPASTPSVTTLIEIKREIRIRAPELQQPINGITVPSQGTMITPIACSWSNSKGATTYEFQLSSDPRFKQVDHQTVITNTKYLITIPLSMGQFYWRVRALSNEESKSPWSKSRTFTVN